MIHYKNLSLQDIEGEIWDWVPDYELLYKSSTLGRVKGVDRILRNGHKWKEKILRQSVGTSKYLTVSLLKDGKQQTRTVHRLIGKTHVPNPLNLEFINHKKGNKLDNRATEIEWTTRSDNEKHKYSHLGIKGCMAGNFGKKHNRSKPIVQMDLQGNVISEFECARQASKFFNCSPSIISRCARGKSNSAKGFIFKFI